jgi:N-acetylmuramate 1-kinase
MPVFNRTSPEDWFECAPERRTAFMEKYSLSFVETVTSDAAPRRFYRVKKGGANSFILIESPPDNHPQSIAGHKLKDFIRTSAELRNIGLSAPEVYAEDLENGYLLVEDFGDQKFNRVINNYPEKEQELYTLAVQALVQLRDQGGALAQSCPPFYGGYLHKAHRQFIDWFVPFCIGRPVTDKEIEEFLKAWEKVEDALQPAPLGPMYVDYHIENLMYLPEREGVRQCGLLDFSMMYNGVPAYDIAHLTMDARRSISNDLREELIDIYTFGLSNPDKSLYRKYISVMGMHFHLKVAGQIIRWVYEGKTGYMVHLPRVLGYINGALVQGEFKPLKNFLDQHEIDILASLPVAERGNLAPLIRDDAFLKS